TSMAYSEDVELLAVKISTAMAARVSYTTVGEEKEVSYEKLIELHDKLINQDPLHASPMEHCARVMSQEEYFRFVRGKVDYIYDHDTEREEIEIPDQNA